MSDCTPDSGTTIPPVPLAPPSPAEPWPAQLPELIPARMLNEFTYCPRLGYLMWVDGEFADSVDTVDGRRQHRRVDREGGPALPAAGASGAGEAAGDAADDDGGHGGGAGEGPTIHARSLLLSSESAGLIARLDLVEAEGLQVTPVDYKRGEKPDLAEGAWEPERVQLCAQGLVLEDNGYRCDGGVLYFAASRSRVAIPFDAALRERTHAQLAAFRAAAARPVPPPPLVDSPRCPRCSLVGICLPDEIGLLAGAAADEAPAVTGVAEARGVPWPSGVEQPVSAEQVGDAPRPADDADPEPDPERVRRLLPARDDALPLYVQDQGARIGKTGECLKVEWRGGPPREVRLLETSQVCLFGGVQITTQAVQELLSRGLPLCWFSQGGWFYGWAQGATHKNVELRRRQYAAAADPARCLTLARNLVSSKIRNCRTLLRRNAEPLDDGVLTALRRAADDAQRAASLEQLLGIEGNAARTYFGAFAGMLRLPDDDSRAAFHPDGRNRRPPKDPINALLSFAYSLLAKDWLITLQAVGFDPLLGFYHQPRYGRPALALDLMEEFRPLIADSVVITLINNREIRPGDFVRSGGAVALKPAGRKTFLQAYERRMDQLVTHPVFNYRISYRRVLEVQARLLARTLSGEIPELPPFGTR